MKFIERIKRFFWPIYEEDEEEIIIPRREMPSFETPNEYEFYLKDNIVYINLDLSKKYNHLIHDSFYSKNYNVRAISASDFKAIYDSNPMPMPFVKKEMPEGLKELVDKKVTLETKSKIYTMKVKEVKTVDKEDDKKETTTNNDKVRNVSINRKNTIVSKDLKLEFDDANKQVFVSFKKTEIVEPKKEKIEKVETTTIPENIIEEKRKQIEEVNKRYVYEYERRQKAKEALEKEVDRAVDNLMIYKIATEILKDESKELRLQSLNLSKEKKELKTEVSELENLLTEKQTYLDKFTKPKTKIKK